MRGFRTWAFLVGSAALVGLAPAVATASHVMSYAEFQRLPQPAAPRLIAYGPDGLQQVELWKPPGQRLFPVVILIHGGCWQTNIAKADVMHRLAEALVDRGVAVWNVEYRGVDVPGGGYPGTFGDIAAAADLLGERGKALGLDTRRVIAMGHSAGGQLALWLAGRHNIARGSRLWSAHPLPVQGVVSLGGLPDLRAARSEAADACGVDTVDRLIGAPTPTHSHPFADTSPVSLLPLGVSQILISGEADVIAPPHFAESYAGKVRRKGDAIVVVTLANQGHFELITPGTPAGNAAIDAALRLLEARKR